ncbi:unnamed protein product [Microthlaspi erraticum]|uniref:F-box associated beta-propeller type 1 domain-containing protein n=1 Tax=Microthlaspi erraticum TaxID=1685480 RepID=A0A6D2IUK1_9BRAS|nr:unnamed protein product [Microthlaspi erraticum]CAA7030257.1 unnamed protein product [Microthlaspi erraticum]
MAMKRVFECFICGVRYEMKMMNEKNVESFSWKEMGGVGASDVAKLLQPTKPSLVEEVEEGKLRVFDGKYKHDFVMEKWRYKYIRDLNLFVYEFSWGCFQKMEEDVAKFDWKKMGDVGAQEVAKEDRVVVWNPYLGQTKWIEPIKSYQISDITYALGYVDDKKKRNHKILRFFNHFQFVKNVYGYEIFDVESNSWKVLDIRRSYWNIRFHPHGVPVKGNAYFLAKGGEVYLVCFDFARERFGPFHPLPFHSHPLHSVTLSCVREEQLAVLFQPLKLPVIEIWVTAKIDEPNPMQWKKFLKVDISGFRLHYFGCFFIDQEKKVAVDFERSIAHIIGDKGFLRKVDIGDAANLEVVRYCRSLVCSYVPSLVQIKQGRD